jgi:predicted SprT family Zn-dependent metalloprotease
MKQPIDQIKEAYTFFNEHLFDNCLPDVVFTITKKKNAAGFFWAAQWMEKDKFTVVEKYEGKFIHEMATNLELMCDWDEKTILSVLVHEMTHIQQQEQGSPSKQSGYHNKEWGDMMKAVGLYPSKTGEKGGKETGVQMFHYVIDGGMFDQCCDVFLKTGFKFNLVNRPLTQKETKRKKQYRANKTKYTCCLCNKNAWAKPNSELLCGSCTKEKGALIEMEAE